MNKFELFSMIFYTLNHYWKDHRSDELGQFLSDMNPFLFDDIGSAIPEIYSQGFLPNYTSGIYENSENIMIVSRGIGNSKFPFRLFNMPEIVVVDIQ